jgi:deferrochelatase/peroxidase EfeB
VARPQPQSGILPEPGESALFLVLHVRDLERDARAVAKIAARVPRQTQKLAAAHPRARLVSVVATGPELWDVLSPGLPRLPTARSRRAPRTRHRR